MLHAVSPVPDITEFLAMLGHELRNPLAAIASATEILKRIGATSGMAGQSRAVIERQGPYRSTATCATTTKSTLG